MNCFIWMAMIAVASAIGVFGYVYYPKYSWRSVVRRHIAENLSVNRVSFEPEEAIRNLSEVTGVPFSFAKMYMDCLCQSYGVPLGSIQPEDRFVVELAIPRNALPPGVAKRCRYAGEYADGDLLYDFITWDYADQDHRIPHRRLKEVAGRFDKDLDLTVGNLCRELYGVHILEKGPDADSVDSETQP